MIQATTDTTLTAYLQTEDNRINTSVASTQIRHLVKFTNDMDKSIQYAYSTVDLIYNRYTKFVFKNSALPSKISDCSDFVAGVSTFPYVLVATLASEGASSQAEQTFTMNVTSLPVGGANFRVFKTTSGGAGDTGVTIPLTLGINTKTVPAVSFNRTVKFQFDKDTVEFDSLILNGVASTCPAAINDVYTGRLDLVLSGYYKYEVYEVSWTGSVVISAGNAPINENDVLTPPADNKGVVQGLVTKGKMYLADKSGTAQVQYTQRQEPSGTNYIYYGQ